MLSSPRPAVTGLRPMDSSTLSASITWLPFPEEVTTRSPAAVCSIFSTLVSVCTSMPELANSFRRHCTISPSMAAISSGSISTIVTLQPKLLYTLANSQPITPPPIMQRLAGTAGSESASSLVMTSSSSAPGIGTMDGSEPVAIMARSKPRVETLPSAAVISSSRSPINLPEPLSLAILFFLSSASMPPVFILIILSLRFCSCFQFTETSAVSRPSSLPSRFR
ncbi:hypothetical protein D3C71_1577170 [compost metagenome]